MLTLESVDLTEYSKDNLEEVAKKVADICQHGHGFFYLKFQQGEERVQNILRLAEQIFNLPDDEKSNLDNDETCNFKAGGRPIAGTGPGYRGRGCDPNFSLDTRESFNVGSEVFDEEHNNSAGTNKWPSEELLPRWKEEVSEYSKLMLELSVKLRSILAVALGLEFDFFSSPGYFDYPTWLLGFVHYFSGSPSSPQTGLYGIRPHTDSGIFTLLASDGQPGLQVCLHDQEWVSVAPPPPGHLVVNLGKNMEVWSGGRFRATLHRVVMSSDRDRYSVPFFYESNLDARVKPLPGIVGSLLEETTPAQLLDGRLTKTNINDTM